MGKFLDCHDSSIIMIIAMLVSQLYNTEHPLSIVILKKEKKEVNGCIVFFNVIHEHLLQFFMFSNIMSCC